MKRVLGAVLAEPPLRLLVRALLRVLPASPVLRAQWDAAPRPQYLTGLVYAALEARRQGHRALAAIEFGVATGDGLLTLQAHAQAIEVATGVAIRCYGFDTGGGLPDGTGDYRDHPDQWQAGDYRMDVAGLQSRLTERTTLVLGDIRDTVGHQPIPEALGFIAVDVDFYSSAVDALRILLRPDVAHLRRVAMYFDDTRMHWNHRFAGELLAIDEFNAASASVKIDQWRGLRAWRPFPEAAWHEGMYLAHDLAAISSARCRRGAAQL